MHFYNVPTVSLYRPFHTRASSVVDFNLAGPSLCRGLFTLVPQGLTSSTVAGFHFETNFIEFNITLHLKTEDCVRRAVYEFLCDRLNTLDDCIVVAALSSGCCNLTPASPICFTWRLPLIIINKCDGAIFLYPSRKSENAGGGKRGRVGEKVKRGTDIKTVVKHWYDVNMTRLQVYFCRHLQIHAREKQVSCSQCVCSNLLIRTPK